MILMILTIVKNQMQKIAESVKLLFNVDCEVKFAEGYPLQSIVRNYVLK